MNIKDKPIRETVLIPYYRPRKNLVEAVKQSSKRRGTNKLFFVFTKLWRNFLQWNAYFCPINTWRILFHRWRGVNIGKNVFIGFQCTLDHAYPEYIYIEDNVSLAGEIHVITHSNPYKHFESVLMSYISPVVIKEGCWIGIRTTVLPNVTIGKYSIVSAGSVVAKDIPDYSVARGNPAVVTKNLRKFFKKKEADSG